MQKHKMWCGFLPKTAKRKMLWKTAVFPGFSTEYDAGHPGVENSARGFPDWRKQKACTQPLCKKQRKTFDFLFYKKQNAGFFAQKLPENRRIHYAGYTAGQF
jgi:hypothetical protein